VLGHAGHASGHATYGDAGHASGHATYGDAGHASGHATYGDAGHAGYATLWCLESWVGRKTWHLKIRWFTPW
jgi:hypothetical protein